MAAAVIRLHARRRRASKPAQRCRTEAQAAPRSTATRVRKASSALALVTSVLVAAPARASFLPPALMDTAAWWLAWFILIFVPIGGIILFWLVHILPEKIAHKRHHPQRDAIQVLCLLSLVFGGLLWPIAWLWAYVKPVTYKMAYGTEKHEDYFREAGTKARSGQLQEHELAHLREELDAMDAKGALTAELKQLRRDLAAATPAPAAPAARQAVSAAIASRGASA
jgi:CBS domain containing-hemolysin-like protein